MKRIIHALLFTNDGRAILGMYLVCNLMMLLIAPLNPADAGPLGWRRGGYSNQTSVESKDQVKQQAPAQQAKGQQVSLDQLPEDGDRPWVLVFTSDDWRQDPVQLDIVEQIRSMEKLAGARIQQYAASHPLHQQYAEYHQYDLPAIMVVVPGQYGESIAAFPTLIRGSSLDFVDNLADSIHLEPSAEDVKLMAGSAEDEKGRPFRWKEPPYTFRPWMWRGRTCRRPWNVPSPYVAPNAPNQPPVSGPIRSYPPVRDTVVRDELKKLKELIKDKLADVDKVAVVKAVAVKAGLGALGGPLLPIAALLLGGGGKFVNGLRRKEDDEEE